MRPGFKQKLKQDPFTGPLFVFRRQRGDLIKIIWWDGQGACLFSKRLEKGRFVWLSSKEGKIALTAAQLAMPLAEVKSQAVLIEKLRHQLAGHCNHRFGSFSERIEQLQLALETSEIAIAKMTAKLRLPDEVPKNKPKRRPIPDHIPRMAIELTTSDDDCRQCGGGMRRLGEDVSEELEYVPGRFIVNRMVRPRFACSGCEAFTQAVLASHVLAGAGERTT